ncbi:MAG: DMT family transporter [Erysipelotrichaceae bacterium]|nr:DMT family transporter [Erysipelotrichaceae bacterium]
MGFLYVIISSLLFGILPSVQNKAILNGADPLSVLLVCNSVCLLGSFFFCLLRRVSLKITGKELLTYLLSGVCIFVTDYCLNLAYTKMPVGLVTMIHFIYPVLICLGAVLFFKEKLYFSRKVAIILSAGGLFFLSDPGAAYSLKGVVYALISAFAYAVNLTVIDRGVISKHDTFLKNFYIFLFSFLFSLAFDYSNLQMIHFKADQIFWMLLSGVILISGSITLTVGIRILGSADAAFISTLEPITSLLVSTFLYHYDLLPRSIIGCILIILSLFPIIRDQ